MILVSQNVKVRNFNILTNIKGIIAKKDTYNKETNEQRKDTNYGSVTFGIETLV